MNDKKWSVLGHGAGGGHFLPTISPHDSSIAMIACDMTGSYITHDAGKSWRMFNLKTTSGCFEFDPNRPDVIYAGSNALYRSQDKGATWKPILPAADQIIEERKVGDHSGSVYISLDNWDQGHICAVTADKNDSSRIYAASVGMKSGTAIYASDNDGKSFKRFQLSDHANRVKHIFPDPFAHSEDKKIFVFSEEGIYEISVDKEIINEICLPQGVSRIANACCGMTADGSGFVIYVTTDSVWEDKCLLTGVWKSKLVGTRDTLERCVTWQRLDAKGIEISDNATSRHKQLPSFNFISTSRHDATVVYLSVGNMCERDKDSGAGSVFAKYGILKSTDEGESWEWVMKGDKFNDPENRKNGWAEQSYTPAWDGIGPKGTLALGMRVCETNPDVCYYTDLCSGFKTEDGGKNWEQVYCNMHEDGSVTSRGLDVTNCYGVHFDPFDPDHLVVSYTDVGLFHSKDGGKSWFHGINGICPAWGNTCYWVVMDPDVKGKAWGAWAGGHDLPRPKMFRNSLLGYLYGGIAKTLDGCDSWKESNNGMPANSLPCHIVMDPNSPANSRTLYTAVFDKGVYKSTDDGNTWVPMNNGLAGNGNMNAFRLCLMPDNTLYLVVSRGLIGHENIQIVDGALYKSTDGAESWEKVNLPAHVNCPNDLIYEKSNPERLFLACWPRVVEGKEYFGGVYVSDDKGNTWRNVFDETAHVYGIAADEKHPGRLFINTFDHSAYRTDDSGETWRRLRGYNFHWGQRPCVDLNNSDMLYLTTFGGGLWHGPADGVPDAVEDIVFE